MAEASKVWWWRVLRALLPKRFAERYADEILRAHVDAARDKALPHGLMFWMRVTIDVAYTAVGARLDSVRRRAPLTAARLLRYLLDALRTDLRYAFRQLARSPVFTVIAAMSLAVGIGVCVGAMNVVHAAYFQQLPVPDAEHVYHVYVAHPKDLYRSTTLANYQDIASTDVFSEVAAATQASAVIAAREITPTRESFEIVTPNYFRMLGVKTQLGRWLSESAGVAAREIVLTDAYWRRQFKGDPSVVGSRLRANGVDLTVVGIGPVQFDGTRRTDDAIIGWLTTDMQRVLYPGVKWTETLQERGWGSFDVIGRLRAGVTPDAAQARLDALAASLGVSYPKSWKVNGRTRRITLLDERASRIKPSQNAESFAIFGVMTLLVALVLVIACMNVAGLMLARAVARQHEVAVRLTLGASRRRLFAQLFSESLLLAILGGVFGSLGVYWVLKIVNTYPDAAALHITSSWRLLVFALVTAVVTALIFGLAPVLQAMRADVRDGLTSTHTPGKGATRTRGRILTIQVAAAFVLLAIAFSTLQGFRAQLRTSPGFETAGLIVGDLRLGGFGGDSVRTARYLQQARRLLANTPGVLSLGYSNTRPYANSSVPRKGLEPMPNGELAGSWRSTQVDPGYFETLQLKIVRGRAFTRNDTIGAELAVVINETYARGYRAAAGDYLDLYGDGTRVRVVGVVQNIVYFRSNEPPQPFIYFPLAQNAHNPYSQSFLMRVPRGREAEMAKQLTRALVDLNPDTEPPPVMSMDDYIFETAKSQRVLAAAALGIGGVELALAAVGLYGILLFAVIARRRELGVRLALGARKRDAGWAVLGHTLKSAVLGLLLGIMCSVPLLLVLSKGGFGMVGIRIDDPVPVLAAISVAVIAVAIAAAGPVSRAAMTNPATALRYE